jgi:hypothetical protein
MELNRNFYGFEISKEFYTKAVNQMCNPAYIDESKQIAGQMNIMDLMKGGIA